MSRRERNVPRGQGAADALADAMKVAREHDVDCCVVMLRARDGNDADYFCFTAAGDPDVLLGVVDRIRTIILDDATAEDGSEEEDGDGGGFDA